LLIGSIGKNRVGCQSNDKIKTVACAVLTWAFLPSHWQLPLLTFRACIDALSGLRRDLSR